MSKVIELNLGKTFGGLKILGRSNKKEKRVFVDCECIYCKSVIPAEVWNVLGGHYKSCGCLKHAFNTKSPRWKGFGEISKTHFNRIKNGASKRGLEFNISIEYIWNLFLKQDRKCSLSGKGLRFPTSRIDYSATASLDRIDPKLGYVEGNLQWVYVDINFMKQDMNNEEFLLWIAIIYKHNE